MPTGKRAGASSPPASSESSRGARRVALILCTLLAVAAVFFVYVSRPRGVPPATAGRLNGLLITLDTLRADHLGCYGDAAALTPTLDALAARGVRFATAVAHVPLTAPSHASILTSRTPLGHGMRDNGAYVLPAGVRSGAEAFR